MIRALFLLLIAFMIWLIRFTSSRFAARVDAEHAQKVLNGYNIESVIEEGEERPRFALYSRSVLSYAQAAAMLESRKRSYSLQAVIVPVK